MNLRDFFKLALANLLRNRVRTGMTLVGVMIGVAALLALLGYGAGLQQNARGEFESLNLFNTLRVTSRPGAINGFSDLSYRSIRPEADTLPAVPLTDILMQAFNRLPGVLAAYPEVVFPVQLRTADREVGAGAEAVPMSFAALPAYQPIAGSFFTSDADTALLISSSMARRLGYEAEPNSIVGDTLTVVTATLDLNRLRAALVRLSFGLTNLPIQEVEHRLVVRGLLAEDETALSGVVRVLVPLELARGMRKVTFFSTIDLMARRGDSSEGYGAFRVQLADPDAYTPVKQSIEATGVFVTSFRDQFQQLERLFFLLDLALAVVGFIALVVATIGIANTMLMNVMERYREIGIMKAVGGDEADLQRLFLTESALIGTIGGLAGVLFGWGLTRLINSLANYYLYRFGLPSLELFYLSPAMVAGVLGVTLVVSLLAGVLPARKAARIEPLEALRHG